MFCEIPPFVFRIFFLSSNNKCFFYCQIELYFVDDEDFGPFSPRNEIGSLNLVLRIIDSLLSCNASHQAIQVLQELRNITLSKLHLVGIQSGDMDQLTIDRSFNNAEEDDSLLSWAKNNGVRSKLNIARKFFSFLLFFSLLLLKIVSCEPLKCSKYSVPPKNTETASIPIKY